MQKNPTQSHYSMKWALEVYYELEQKFGGDQKVFNKIFGITPTMAAKWLSIRSTRWSNYKRLVKVWRNWQRSERIDYENEELLNERIVLLKFMIERWQKNGTLAAK